MSKVVDTVKQAASDVASGVGDIAEGAVSAVGGVGQAAGALVTGGSVSDGLAKATDGISHAGSGYLDAVTMGQGDKLDAVSGGLYSATKNVYETPSDLLKGNSVRDNLQDAGRLGIVAATGGYGGVAAGVAVNSALVGRDGKSDISIRSLARAGSTQVGGVAGNILKQVGYEPPTSSGSRGGSTQSGYYSDTPTYIDQSTGKSSYIIPIVIVFTIAAALLLKKKKH